MRDTMKAIRTGIHGIIDGAISYNSAAVPVYDEKVFTGVSPDLYIIFSTQQESPGPDQNDCTEMVRSSIDIEIIRRTGSEVSKDTIDDVSNDLYGLIVPAHGLAGFTMSGFQIIYAARESAVTQNIITTESESILRKTIRFSFIIVQQN